MTQYYTYMYSDPRNGVPFYVGKGFGTRASKWWNKNKHVQGFIRNLQELGVKHLVEIALVPTEEDAFWFEKDLIASLGRKDKGTGCLLNHTDGGEGVSGLDGPKGPKPQGFGEKIRKALTGVAHSEQRRNNIALATKEAMQRPEVKTKMCKPKSTSVNMKRSDAWKKRASEWNKQHGTWKQNFHRGI